MGASDDAGEGPIDNRFDEVFGDAHSRLLGKAVKRGQSGKLNRNPLAHEKVSSHTDSWDNQYGDWGVDKEAEDLFEEGVSDDDASFVAEEQVCFRVAYAFVHMFVCLCASRVIECNEDYTSKTCGQCGWVNDFKCQAYGYFAGHLGC